MSHISDMFGILSKIQLKFLRKKLQGARVKERNTKLREGWHYLLCILTSFQLPKNQKLVEILLFKRSQKFSFCFHPKKILQICFPFLLNQIKRFIVACRVVTQLMGLVLVPLRYKASKSLLFCLSVPLWVIHLGIFKAKFVLWN